MSELPGMTVDDYVKAGFPMRDHLDAWMRENNIEPRLTMHLEFVDEGHVCARQLILNDQSVAQLDPDDRMEPLTREVVFEVSGPPPWCPSSGGDCDE